MRNKILYTIISGSLLFASCNKSLELQAPYQLTQGNAFPNLDAYNQQLNGIYGSFASANYYNGFHGVTAEIFSDNVYETIESLVNYQVNSNWDYVSTNGYMESVWLQPYNVIFQANTIINGIDKAKSENEKRYNRILGQALTARAIAHFDVLKAFANNLDRNSTDLGVPLKTSTEIATPSRATVKEVYDLIYADLTKAITLLSDVDAAINSASNKAYLDVNGARAAFAKVALYAKDYPTAITYSSALISAIPLATAANFPGIWNDSRTDEVIWAIQNNAGDAGSPYPSADVMSFRFNRNTYGIHNSLLNLYNQSADVRFNTYFFVRNTTSGINNYALQKFKGKGSAADNLVNFKVFRVAEMYLIRAEAYAKSSPADEVKANLDLNTLKAARITGWVPAVYTGAGLINEIENERRRELAGEGHRWFDLKRTTRVVARPLTGLGNPNAQVRTSLAANSTKWVWPIPAAEVLANSSITQNPGY